MRRIQLSKTALQEALTVIRSGGLVVFPSDTVYGLLCDASSEVAVKRLIAFKGRPPGKAISIFVADREMLSSVVDTGTHMQTLSGLLPGPYTIILPSRHRVSPLLESEHGTLGVRLPQYEPVQTVTRLFGNPLTATSANLSGKPACHSVEAFVNSIPVSNQHFIDLIVDAGSLGRKKPSTLIDFTTDRLQVKDRGNGNANLTDLGQTLSETETATLAGKVVQTLLSKKKQDKAIVMVLRGELGAGKTQFAKGVGAVFGLTDIISPTFVGYYDYQVSHPKVDVFIHADLYAVQDAEELRATGLLSLITERSIACIEWGDRSADFLRSVAKKAQVVEVSIEYRSPTVRQLYMTTCV